MSAGRALLVAVVLACVLIVVGVVGLCGVWWGCIAAGVMITAGVVLLYDPQPDKPKRRSP